MLEHDAAKNFDILATCWSTQHLDNPIKLFSDRYLTELVDTSTELLFPCKKEV